MDIKGDTFVCSTYLNWLFIHCHRFNLFPIRRIFQLLGHIKNSDHKKEIQCPRDSLTSTAIAILQFTFTQTIWVGLQVNSYIMYKSKVEKKKGAFIYLVIEKELPYQKQFYERFDPFSCFTINRYIAIRQLNIVFLRSIYPLVGINVHLPLNLIWTSCSEVAQVMVPWITGKILLWLPCGRQNYIQ